MNACWTRARLVPLTLLFMLGCDLKQSPAPSEDVIGRDGVFTTPVPSAKSSFDPRRTGTVEGCVRWCGSFPTVRPWVIDRSAVTGQPLPMKTTRANPNAPRLDPRSRAVQGAVVSLRRIDPNRSKPWQVGRLTVEQRDGQFRLWQDGTLVTHGIVRTGDPVELVSRDDEYQGVHGGGASYFSVSLPVRDRPRVRRFERPGVVELSGTQGNYWTHAYAVVSDHPYVGVTGADGWFEFTQVPEGTYEVVCWLPNWHAALRERDAELGVIWRVVFEPPAEKTAPVEVRSDDDNYYFFEFSPADFPGGD